MAGLIKWFVIVILTYGFISCVPGLLLSYYKIKDPDVAKYPPELVSGVADCFQKLFTYTLRFFLVSVVCLVGSIYARFNPRQQNLQAARDPDDANATASNIPAATDISSGVDSASHSDLPVPGTIDGSTRDQAPGTRHGTPDASAKSQRNRPNLMEIDFGPEFNSNLSGIRNQASSAVRSESALESRKRDRHRARTPTPLSRFRPPSSIADTMAAEMYQPADNRRTIHDDIEKWIKDSWITHDEKKLIRISPRRMQTRSKLLYKQSVYEKRYQKEAGFRYDDAFDVYGTPVSYHYDLMKCSLMFRLWTRQTRINGLPEQYDPDLARDPAPGQFLPEDEDAKSVITSATTLN
ncbi:MAG: hypothetical protein LQ345_003077 [Seirophora villosa]|nr:MAG: hypothetical protein LQ345_003077 [Seirophora villosa]